MIVKWIVFAFMLFVSFFVRADKTYRHDRAECNIQGQKIQFELRSRDRYSSAEDKEYGHFIQMKHGDKNITIQRQDSGFGRLRMLNVSNEYCSKILAQPKEDQIYFFFLKDNRPLADIIMTLVYNPKTSEAQLIQKDVLVKNGMLKEGRIYFQIAHNNFENRYGTVQIGQDKFHFIEKTLEPWMAFDGQKFQMDKELTFEKFEYKHMVTKSMLENLDEKNQSRYKIAINKQLQKQCIALDDGDWICR